MSLVRFCPLFWIASPSLNRLYASCSFRPFNLMSMSPVLFRPLAHLISLILFHPFELSRPFLITSLSLVLFHSFFVSQILLTRVELLYITETYRIKYSKIFVIWKIRKGKNNIKKKRIPPCWLVFSQKQRKSFWIDLQDKALNIEMQ